MNDDKICNRNRYDDSSEDDNAQFDEDNPIVLAIKKKRDFYTNEIRRINDIFDGYKDVVNNLKLKGRKKYEAQKCLNNLNGYKKEVMTADNQVQRVVNALLDYKGQVEGIKKIFQEFGIPQDIIQGGNLSDYDPTEIIGLPAKYSKSRVFCFYNKASSIYQLFVYNVVESLLDLHQKIMLFTFHLADIAWVMETDFKKKKMTSNEFIAKLIPSKLSREVCFDCIKDVLGKNGIDSIPSSAILKELSSWNVYISSNGKKGAKPLLFYDFKRHSSKKDFKDWVESRYLPAFKERRHRTVDPKKQKHGKYALEQAAKEQVTDVDEFYDNIDMDLEEQQSTQKK